METTVDHSLFGRMALLGLALACSASLAAASLPSPAADGATTSWGDYDGDGLADLYIRNPDAADVLAKNHGDGTFTDVTAAAGLPSLSGSRAALWSDVDGDGRLDLLVVDREGGLRLFAAVRGATFVDQSASGDLAEVRGASGAEWRDFDGDGALDLFVHSAEGDRLFRNDGQATFALVTLPGSPVAAGGGSSVQQSAQGAGAHTLFGACAQTIQDAAMPGTCLPASSIPMVGSLYPISSDWFIDAATGNVGIGNMDPQAALDVAGPIRSRTGGIEFPDGSVQLTATLQGPAGATGPVGPTGSVGPTGATGAAGAEGPAGPAGPTGPAGLDGADGAQGPVGPTGPIGLAGSDSLWTSTGSDMHSPGAVTIGSSSAPLAGIDVHSIGSESLTHSSLRLPTSGGSTHLRFGRLGTAADELMSIAKNYWRDSTGFLVEDAAYGSQSITFREDGELRFATGPIGTTPSNRLFIAPGGNVTVANDLTAGSNMSVGGALNVVGAVDTSGDMTVDGQLRTGFARMGSETGTSRSAGYLGTGFQGLIVRRTAGYALTQDVLARSESMRLWISADGPKYAVNISWDDDPSRIGYVHGTLVLHDGSVVGINHDFDLTSAGTFALHAPVGVNKNAAYVSLIIGEHTKVGLIGHNTEVKIANGSYTDPTYRGVLMSTFDQ